MEDNNRTSTSLGECKVDGPRLHALQTHAEWIRRAKQQTVCGVCVCVCVCGCGCVRVRVRVRVCVCDVSTAMFCWIPGPCL